MRRAFTPLFVILLATALSSQALWAGAREGQTAFDAGDYARALKEWLPSAREGDAGALLGLGRLYEVGLGVEQDLVKAHLFYNLADFRGNSEGRQARDALERIMHDDEITRAKQWALDLVSKRQYVPAEVVAAAGGASPPAAAAPQLPPAPPSAPAAVSLRFEHQCALQRTYQDRGSGGRQDLSVYVPKIRDGFAAIGGYAQGNYDDPDGCVLLVATQFPEAGRLTAVPAQWQQIWNDAGSGARKDGSIWTGVPPSPDFVCIGSIGVEGYQPPQTSSYVCVHRCLTTPVQPTNPIWTDEGTGAKQPVSLYRLPFSNSFAAVPARKPPQQLLDVKPGARCP